MNWMKYTEDESQEMIARMKIQKLEELKLQVMAQNPQLLGVGVPGDGETEIGAEAGGPNPMLGPEGAGTPGAPDPMGGGGAATTPPDPTAGGGLSGTPPIGDSQPPPQQGGGAVGNIEDPDEEYIKKYNLSIEDYATEIDEEEVDFSEVE